VLQRAWLPLSCRPNWQRDQCATAALAQRSESGTARRRERPRIAGLDFPIRQLQLKTDRSRYRLDPLMLGLPGPLPLVENEPSGCDENGHSQGEQAAPDHPPALPAARDKIPFGWRDPLHTTLRERNEVIEIAALFEVTVPPTSGPLDEAVERPLVASAGVGLDALQPALILRP
jgi:hypothetical protein